MELKYVEVITTFPSEEEALRVANLIVERRLGACAQVSGGVKSVYRWMGKVCVEPEWLLTVKTKREVYKELESFLKEVHPYKVPQIIALPIIEGYGEYLKWIEEEVK